MRFAIKIIMIYEICHKRTRPFQQRFFKGIVSRDCCGLQMIFIYIIVVPDVPLEVYSFLNFCFHIQ